MIHEIWQEHMYMNYSTMEQQQQNDIKKLPHVITI